MRKLRTTSLADLLEAMYMHSSELDQCAAVFGYERKFVPASTLTPMTPKADSTSTQSTAKPELPKPQIRFPTERPRLKFLMPVRAEKLESVPPDPVVNPITDAELAVDWTQRGPRMPPLVRWSRLGSFLRNRLGRTTEGTLLDQVKLMRMAGSGSPLTVLPRLKRRAWAPQAVVLWDTTPEMFPFTRDVKWLLHQLRRERGKFGLIVKEIRGAPRLRDVAGVPAGTPILAISAMGCFRQLADIISSWIKFAKRLDNVGLNLLVLNPCQRERWPLQLAAASQSVVWDRHPRLPRHGGQRGAVLKTDQESPSNPANPVVEQLLTLLSPASFIEAPLLRAARLKLGRKANAGTEWDTWHHADCWHSIDSFGIKPGEPFKKRLEQRSQLNGTEAELARNSGDMIVEHHQGCSSVIRFEAELRACLTGEASEANLNRLKALLQSVVDRLRQLAKQPGGSEGEQTGLPLWFAAMVDRLSPDMVGESNIQKLLADGLALAHTWLETPRVALPIKMDTEAYSRALRSLIESLPDSILFESAVHHKELLVFPATDRPSKSLFPTGLIRAGYGHVQIHASGQQAFNDLCEKDTKTKVLFDKVPAQVAIETPYDRLHLKAMERPEWASRMWSDRFGTALEFVIRDVPFVLRWIPPGTFWMGSPDNELGRASWEGPRHEVTISQGYWMGETPVTQVQWAVIVEPGKAGKRIEKGSSLKSKPSEFSAENLEGKGDLPVEKVSWNDSTSLCELLNRLIENGPGFRLPTEAQWEHACRAGTQTAFNDGSECTLPEGLDPALNRLGWFDKNSGGRTQFVKQRPANRWGLYDMHGNVWEWCRDAWERNVYEKRAEGIIDPEEKSNAEGASRVVRGGSWFAQAQVCRAAFRSLGHPGSGWGDYGLRLSAGQELETSEAEPTAAERS